MKRIVFIISIVILLGIGWVFTISDFLNEKSKENYQEQLIIDADNYVKEVSHNCSASISPSPL